MSEYNGKYNNRSIKSPFRYAGGKYYARKQIVEHLIKSEVYCEPFAGGASIFFCKDKSNVNILNDLDSDMMLVYKIIRDRPDDMIQLLKTFDYPSKEAHTYYKNEYKPRNELESAVRWYYLNRTSYSGIMKFENMYFGYNDKYSMRPENWQRVILRASDKLQGVKLLCHSAIDIIDDLPSKSLVFIDPPYYSAKQDQLYTKHFSKQDHLDLADCLRCNFDRLNIFLTYDNCDEVRELYSFMPYMYDKEWKYFANRNDYQKKNNDNNGNRYVGKELFILNYSK